jgi:hypothetical protein
LWPAVFRAENTVHQDFGVSVGHTDTLFVEVMGVGDSSHRRGCRRSAARLILIHAAGAQEAVTKLQSNPVWWNETERIAIHPAAQRRDEVSRAVRRCYETQAQNWCDRMAWRR